MNVFVFIEKGTQVDLFNLGIMREDEKISEMQLLKDMSDTGVRDIINQIPTGCVFVGQNLRQGVLSELMHSLCRKKLDLPEKLKFHWVPPYKLPLDDLDWLFNFGMFGQSMTPLSTMASELGITIDPSDVNGSNVKLMAKVYFTIVGDFNKF